eukprot:TRINITY_DN28479_c0_g1_i1.p1 TRINITY_DN28479_c0_g1~~TRINITY_DN28479_c0_g1_i1.p1  ORF type:complete len:182 (+),score=18.47 TRINITY_DN28479_c0_g1_i1:73-618(+)
MLTEAGCRKLTELRKVLVGDGFESIEFLSEENLGSGNPRMFLAVAGYLQEVMYRDVALLWHQKYPWFVTDESDYIFIEKLWKVMQLETGNPPKITVAQFFSPKFADLKIDILLSLTKLMRKTHTLKRQRVCRKQTDEPAPAPAPPPVPQQPVTNKSVAACRPTKPNQAVVFKALPRKASEP